MKRTYITLTREFGLTVFHREAGAPYTWLRINGRLEPLCHGGGITGACIKSYDVKAAATRWLAQRKAQEDTGCAALA